MRQSALLTCFAMAAIFTSCQTIETEPAAAEENITFEFTVDNLNCGDGTRAMKQGWENGDRINLWFDNNAADKPDLVITYTDGNWVNGPLRSGVVLNSTGYVAALYEGHNNLSSYALDDLSDMGYMYYSRTKNDFPLAAYLFRRPSYTFQGNTLKANLTGWQFTAHFQVVVDGLNPADATSCTLKCNHLQILGAILVYNYNGYGVSQSEGGVNQEMTGVPNADGVAFYFSGLGFSDSVSGKAADYTFTLSEGGREKTYTSFNKTLTVSNSKCQAIRISYSDFK